MAKKKKHSSKNQLAGNHPKKHSMRTSPSSTGKISLLPCPDEVDLHLDSDFIRLHRIDAAQALLLQLEEAEKSIDAAVAAGKLELRLIHGIGKGKLKEEVHKLLKKHPLVCSFENDYSPKYGWGSTLVKFY
jgi:DNA-nicking Smr family endonuclease